MKEVKLKVNNTNLVNNMRFAFTNKETLISELMQNARRSGSNFVSFDYDEDNKELVIDDAGCGIDDPQKILTIAESGWDRDVIETETPYGVGFLSALFLSERVCIESNQMLMEFDTQSALMFGMISVLPSERRIGTKIALKGIQLDVEKAVKRFAKGFPIRVILNGEEIERKHAIDSSLSFKNTSIGKIHLCEFDEPIGNALFHTGTLDSVIYLQGIEVYRNASHGKHNIIHLDPTQFFGRLPDRDKLINEPEEVRKVKDVIRQYWVKRLRRDVFLYDNLTIASQYFSTLKYWGVEELLNHIDYLPREVLETCDVYPFDTNDWESVTSSVKQPILKEDIVSGKVRILNLFDVYNSCDDSFHVAMYAYGLNAVTYDGRLPSSHWLNDYVIEVSEDDVNLSLKGELHYASSYGDWYEADAVFCKEAVLTGPCGDVIFDDEALYIRSSFVQSPGYPNCFYENKGLTVIPDGEHTGEVVSQLSHYRHEFDFDETAYEMDKAHFERFIVANRPGQEIELIRRELDTTSLDRHSCLAGATFKITVLEDFDPEETRSYYEVEFVNK